jgi:hypothetical protein
VVQIFLKTVHIFAALDKDVNDKFAWEIVNKSSLQGIFADTGNVDRSVQMDLQFWS